MCFTSTNISVTGPGVRDVAGPGDESVSWTSVVAG